MSMFIKDRYGNSPNQTFHLTHYGFAEWAGELTVMREHIIHEGIKTTMIKIDLEKKIAVIEIGGTPTHIEIQEAIDELLKHPDHTDGMDEIWDFSKASMKSFNKNELTLLADFVRTHLPKLAKRVAYVSAKDLDYGIGRMWMVYAEISDAIQERQLFRNMEEAVEWLVSTQKL